jgi:hypothetical protein
LSLSFIQKTVFPPEGATVSGDFAKGEPLQFRVLGPQKIAHDKRGVRHFKRDGYFRINRRLQFEPARFKQAGQFQGGVSPDCLPQGKEKALVPAPRITRKKRTEKTRKRCLIETCLTKISCMVYSFITSYYNSLIAGGTRRKTLTYLILCPTIFTIAFDLMIKILAITGGAEWLT